MKKNFFLKSFFSIVRSYSPGEKIFSLFLLFLMFFSLARIISGDHSPRDSDTYYEGLVGYSSVLNPLFVDFNEVDREISRLIFSGLLKYDSQKRAVVEDMAQVKIDATQTQYTVRLKDYLKWHDGEPVTADDVYFTFAKVIQSPEFFNPLLKANFEGVDIEKIDDKSVKFILNKPNSFFLANLTVGLLPYHLFKDVPVAELKQSPLNQNPVGTGPYRVSSPYRLGLDEEGEIRLTRFKDYYGGVSFLPNIVFRTYPSFEILLSNREELNAISKLPSDFVSEFQDKKDYQTLPYELFQYTAVFMNMDHPFLQDRNVRLALQKSVDKEKLLQLIPYRIRVDTPLLELNQKDWIYLSDFTQAQGALFAAGFKLDKTTQDLSEKIRRNKKGEILRLRLLTVDFSQNSRKKKEITEIADFLIQSWESAGIQIEIESLPLEEYTERVWTRDYDLLLAGQNLGYNFDTYYFWHSTQASEDGLNLSNYKSFAADASIEEIRRTIDEGKKKKSLQKLAKIIGEDIPAIFLFRDIYFYISDRSVSELYLENIAFPADRFANIVDWKKK